MRGVSDPCRILKLDEGRWLLGAEMLTSVLSPVWPKWNTAGDRGSQVAGSWLGRWRLHKSLLLCRFFSQLLEPGCDA